MGILLCGGFTVLISATLLFLWLYNRHKRVAFIVGYGTILLSWMIMVIRIYGACLECTGDELCCEWTGIGLMMYSVMALIIAIAFSIFVYANHQAEEEKKSRISN